MKLDDGYDSVDYYAPANLWNYKAKKCIFGHIWPHRDLDGGRTFWPLKLMCLSLPQSPIVVKVWSNFVNEKPRYLTNNVCSLHARTDRRTHARTLRKHNASGHYVGESMKMPRVPQSFYCQFSVQEEKEDKEVLKLSLKCSQAPWRRHFWWQTIPSSGDCLCLCRKMHENVQRNGKRGVLKKFLWALAPDSQAEEKGDVAPFQDHQST